MDKTVHPNPKRPGFLSGRGIGIKKGKSIGMQLRRHCITEEGEKKMSCNKMLIVKIFE